ncbi:(2Fe-2S)-binding protein [Phyllobacterium phragmitis]|uniref:(2Fe-2S)-binding protein n=1 Tax=Phyllobacterium phragmitis TaxID=2670329 RepID=A0A2S9IT22_9HYPH|nr:FAD-dependent oxidoreductase [Phyllobacterium phragmitis]PRD43674.1 (2Fe-2S)-binding protein [Phyllobacterium phragmitis]
MNNDVVVIGAGPAGMAAAIQASSLGLKALVLDEQPAPGGQRFRAIEQRYRRLRAAGKGLPASEQKGLDLIRRFRESDTRFVDQASVWDISPGGRQISYLHHGRSFTIPANAVVAAPGAYERPVPLEGWHLPGVMSAGAAQTMLKMSGHPVKGRIVLLGCGPLLLLTARQLSNAGANVVGLLQTTGPADFLRATPYLPAALRSATLLKQGLQLLTQTPLVPKVFSLTQASIIGADHVEGVNYRSRGGSGFIECDAVLLHFGVIPNTQLSRLAGVAHDWNEQQECWQPVVDAWQETSAENLMVAGDGGGILGDEAAEMSGRLSILRIAHRLGRISDQSLSKLAAPLQRGLKRLAAARALIDTIFHTPETMLIPSGDTVVCRCEEVTAAEIAAANASGASGLRHLKVQTRVGMGPCRAQMCSMAAMAMITPGIRCGQRPPPPATVRAPIRPLTIGQLAEADVEI